jgi:hypothetical protein
MVKKRKNNYYALICDDCGKEIFCDVNMVMVKDSLWAKICDEWSDDLCDKCMEKRMGRKITKQDFKKPSIAGVKVIPCNQWWLLHKKENKI